ncbi:GDP-mannose 4,6-dehydratase [uncultured Candidatus Thioglobus sp.]|nr:GDP-mannose 4,6-dehydratase [uncultured Candidatus Thioglobus sp.]
MSLVRIIQQIQPDEIYNLGAQSHVAVSFETPEYTADTIGLGALRILEAIRISGLEKKPVIIRSLLQNYMAKCKKFPKKKPRHFIHARLMLQLNCMPIG